ncbi:DUF2795 domain-containing protein [Nocardiopsis lucentensis]|uniref:DUF2795 domain-containing protein n=1 Tax=Nocardiopsis lucentensis TaxID=53441 RepID=UPI00034B6704|nr:DUF2795 domain-containing protein [Nocardiopsis lucentensis]
MPSRTDIADHLEGAFSSGPLNRGQVISAAGLQGAPEAVLKALGDLPEGFYSNLRQLWPHLPAVHRPL